MLLVIYYALPYHVFLYHELFFQRQKNIEDISVSYKGCIYYEFINKL